MTSRFVRGAMILALLPMLGTARAAAQSTTANSAAPSAAAPARPSVFDNLDFFVGPDGSKQPQDLGINANMGIRFSGNIGVPLARRAHVGMQVGVAFNASDAAVHVLDQIDGTSSRRQTFLTIGVFQRTDRRLSWGLAYDASREAYFDHFHLSQWRGEASLGVTKSDELGAWFTKGVKGDDGSIAGTAVRLDAIGQVNFFTRHTWANAAKTAVWVGVAGGHDDVVFVFPENPRDKHVLVYGAELYVPLSERFAITGSANLLTPAATGTVDAFLGVAFYPKRGAMRATHSAFAPMMAVANNPTFSVNLKR